MTPVSSPVPRNIQEAGPSARSVDYYTEWVEELTLLHKSGMLDDEDFALQRAERLHQLLERPVRRWLGWILIGLPLTVAATATAWWYARDGMTLAAGGVVMLLCMLGALARLSRERREHLTGKQRSGILYELLNRDLISSEEFLAFDECVTGRTGE